MTHYLGNNANVMTLSAPTPHPLLLNWTASVNVQVNGACLCDVWSKPPLCRKDISAHNISLQCSVPPLLYVMAVFHIFNCVNIWWAYKMWNAMARIKNGLGWCQNCVMAVMLMIKLMWLAYEVDRLLLFVFDEFAWKPLRNSEQTALS